MSHAAGQSTRPAIPKSTPPRVAKSTTPLTRLFPNNVRGRISAFIVRESRRMRNGIGILYYTLAHGHGQTATGSTASDVGRGDRSADGREPPLRRRGELLRATVCASLRDRRPPPHTCPWPRKRSEAAARAPQRIQSRSLDADALWDRHAACPSGPLGGVRDRLRYTLLLDK